ncbi:MAG: hypothetical protein KGO05_01750, partial [Chloroflexota bacterium]|nr:hypothetical protein [Chloroflexota bacterium]
MAKALMADSPAARHPRWWLALRVAWVVYVALRLIDFASSLPAYVAAAGRPAAQNGLFTAAQAQAIQQIGVSLGAYALATAGLFALCVLMATVIALFLFWRRSQEWMALVVAYFLVVNPINSLSSLIPQDSAPTGPGSIALTLALGLPAILVSLGIYLLFPSGRFEPRWSWVLLPIWLAWFLLVHARPDLLHGPLALGYPVLYGGAILCQVYRYRRVSTPVERQQTKWAATGLVVALLANQLFWLPLIAPPLTGFPLFIFIALIVYALSLMLMQVMFFIALQRYRLYDIDVFINRALVYGALTVALAGVYLAGVVGVQAALNQLFGLREASYPPL